MDTTDPNIIFDSNGVCNHCHEYKVAMERSAFHGTEAGEQLSRLVAKIKEDGRKRSYDCVIGLSGGVDSSYVAYKVKELGLRPLAVHLDNGWDSEMAVSNIENICTKLEIDLKTVVLDWGEFSDLQLAFLRASTPDSEIPSDHAIVASNFLTARELGVGHVIFGYNGKTESHLPRAWSQGYFDWRYITAVHREFGTRPLKTFPGMNMLNYYVLRKKVAQHNILQYLNYSKKDAMVVLEQKLGWRNYGGKHHESIYTRFYQGYILPVKFGFDKRKAHLSSLVCSGETSREAALEELKKDPYPRAAMAADKKYVAKKLGISDGDFDSIMSLPLRSFDDYPSYAKIYKNPVYRFLRNCVGKILP